MRELDSQVNAIQILHTHSHSLTHSQQVRGQNRRISLGEKPSGEKPTPRGDPKPTDDFPVPNRGTAAAGEVRTVLL